MRRLALVCTVLLTIVACGFTPYSPPATDVTTNDPSTDSTIGAPLAIGVTGTATGDGKYHFTTAHPYTVSWTARMSAAGSGCTFILVVTDSKATLNATSLHPAKTGETGTLAGSAKGFHIAQVSGAGCDWVLQVTESST